MKIKSVKIVEPAGMFGGKATVHATFENGSEKVVLSYYSDELSFHPSEFIGLTEAEVGQLFHQRDVAYLRS